MEKSLPDTGTNREESKTSLRNSCNNFQTTKNENDGKGIWKTQVHRKKGLEVAYVLSEEHNDLFLKEGQERIIEFLNSFRFSLDDEAFAFTSIAKIYMGLRGKKDLEQEISMPSFPKKFCIPTRLDSYFDSSLQGRHTFEEAEEYFSREEKEVNKFIIAERLLVQMLIPSLDLSQSYYYPEAIVHNNSLVGCNYWVYDLSKI